MFITHTKNQALTNNMCEQFNVNIVKCRSKLIILMLEEIKLYLVDKHKTRRKLIKKKLGLLPPKVKERLDEEKNQKLWMDSDMDR